MKDSYIPSKHEFEQQAKAYKKAWNEWFARIDQMETSIAVDRLMIRKHNDEIQQLQKEVKQLKEDKTRKERRRHESRR